MEPATNNGEELFVMRNDQLYLLQVARSVPQPFTVDDLSVAAWKAHPDKFGMPDYPYPDKHKVHELVYGNEGMIVTGMLREVQMGLLRASDDLERDANSL